MRLMKENDLSVRPRRRFVVTTDSDHDGPIFPNLREDVAPTGPNQLWVADITFIAIAVGFVYLAAILDAWSRRVVGYAIGRRVDARLVSPAHSRRQSPRPPPKGCIHHSDRGSQYAAGHIAPSSAGTVCGARWAGAATRTTTPRPKAS